MEDMYQKILWEGYGLRYQSGVRTRTGLVCQTDQGLRELKKARSSRREILLAHDVKCRLYENGFTSLCRFATTQDGNPFFVWDGTYYLLEDVMQGEAIEEEQPQDWLDGAALMAKMHCAANGLKLREGLAQAEALPQVWQKRLNELAKIKKRIERQSGYSALDLLVLRYYQPFFTRAQRALEQLQQANYTKLRKQQQAQGVFCHNRIKGNHLYRQTDGSLWIGGFEHCTADVFLLDLATYLKRLWRKTQGDVTLLESAVDIYCSTRDVSEEEMRLLLPLTAYPEKFLRLVHENYNKRQVCISPAMLAHLTQTAEEETSMGILEQYLTEN